MNRNRKKYKELVVLNGDIAAPMKKIAQQKICQMPISTGTIFRKLEYIKGKDLGQLYSRS